MCNYVSSSTRGPPGKLRRTFSLTTVVSSLTAAVPETVKAAITPGRDKGQHNKANYTREQNSALSTNAVPLRYTILQYVFFFTKRKPGF